MKQQYNLIDIIFPPRCILCSELVARQGDLCTECWNNIDFITDPLCDCCGIPFEYKVEGEVLCGECILNRPVYNKSRTVFDYNDNSRKLITRFKYADKIHACNSFAKWMQRAGSEIIKNSDLIVPVPLHRIRLFTRRYNQSALLAGALGKLCGLPVYQRMLVRRKYTTPQAGLTRTQRIKNVRYAFAVNKKLSHMLNGKNVILVDDVITTGATIDACAKTLLKGGAASVNVLTIAKTIKG